MQQTEIKFFWPLTEQMELDLDYSNCARTRGNWTTQTIRVSNGSTGQVLVIRHEPVWKTPTINLDEINFTLNKKPFIIKRILYKLLGLNWMVR